MENMQKTAMQVNWILLGLVMLVPGLLKLFVMKPAAVVDMLSAMPFFGMAPMLWAWVLIISEILFGILILAKYQLKYTTIPPMIILLVAAFMVYWGNWGNLLIHLTLVSNYWLLGARKK